MVIVVNVAVIGMGLIGGSLLRALAAAGHQVTGYDLDASTRQAAHAAGQHRWRVLDSVSDAVHGVDLVIVATPLPAVQQVLEQVVRTGYRGIVTDVVSVKGPVRDLVARYAPQARYVGGHPMAGKETAGFAASDPELFTNCAWVLCLDEQTALADWISVARLATALHARVVPATAQAHDRAVAAISHVPHLLALALAEAATNPLAATLAAGSFRDGTRVAASPPELVAAMCGGNAAAVGEALDRVLASLAQARAALASPEPIAAIRDWARPGHAARTGWGRPQHQGPVQELPTTADALLKLGAAGGWVVSVADDGRSVAAVTAQ